MPDTVPAMLEPGEYVIRKDAADKIGLKNLEMLNNIDRLENGNTAIDELIALSTLNGSQGMMSGGNVKKMPQSGYMQDGGDVKAYIDSSDSSVVVANPKQSKMFDEIINSVNFAPKTSKKYQLETIIDMLNNPDKYKEGVDADFPVTGESLGAVDSLAMYMNKFNQDRDFMGYGDEEAGILEQFGRPEFRRAGRTAQDEEFIMNENEILEALNYIAGRHQQGTLGMGASKGSVPGLQDGGYPTIESYYNRFGGMPEDANIRSKFERLYGYDPQEEISQVGEYTQGARGVLSEAMDTSRAQGAMQGFSGMGGIPDTLKDIRSEYSETTSGIRQDVRDDAMLSAVGALADYKQSDARFTGSPGSGGSGNGGGSDSNIESFSDRTSEGVDEGAMETQYLNYLPTSDQGYNVMYNNQLYVWDWASNSYIPSTSLDENLTGFNTSIN